MKVLLGIVLLVALSQAYPKKRGARIETGTGMSGSVTLGTVTYNNTFENHPHDEDFNDIAEAFKFPGSRYLHDLIAEHYETEWLDDPADIKDHFEFPHCDMDEFRKQAFGVYKATEDPQGTAILATRYITKRVLHQKMKCPSSVIDSYIVSMLYMGRSEYFSESDSRMYRYLMEKVPYVNSELAPYTEDVTRRAVERFDKLIFNKTIEFMVAFGLRDVAFYSQDVYRGLWDFFKYYMPNHGSNGYGSTPYSSLVDTLQAYMWEVRCYDFQEMSETHRRMINMFRNEFVTVETSRICVELEDFFNDYMRALVPNKPNMDLNLDRAVVYTMCEEIQDVVGEIMSYMEQYENALYEQDLNKLEEFLRDFVSETQWRVFSEAARKLGFYNKNGEGSGWGSNGNEWNNNGWNRRK